MRINKDEGLSHIAYFRTDGGSPRLYTEEFVDGLIKRISKAIKYIENATEEAHFENDKLIDILEILKDDKKW